MSWEIVQRVVTTSGCGEERWEMGEQTDVIYNETRKKRWRRAIPAW